MNTNDGTLMRLEDIPQEKMTYFVPVKRDLTAKERAEMQIRKYAPCGCGSGRKFKFCCYKPLIATLDALAAAREKP